MAGDTYVCDTDAVRSIGESVKGVGTDLNGSIGTYETNSTQELSTWNGEAKDSFSQANSTQVQTGKETSEYVENLGTFIGQVADEIDKLEEQLADQSI